MMTRKSFRSTLVALFAMTIIMLVAGTGSAAAQQNLNCCVYYVDVANFPAACFPVNLWTNWSSGVAGPVVLNGNASYPFPYVFAAPQPCPLAPTFLGASFAGPGGPFATFNNPVQFNVNGCCFIARIAYDQNGCTYITVRPC